MESINWECGFFHLVFANQDDLYATDHPLMLPFEKFMVYQLKRQAMREIKYIYYINENSQVNGLNYESESLLVTEVETRGIWGWRRRQNEQTDEWTSKIEKIASIMKKGNTAVMIDSMAACRLMAEQAKLLSKLTDHRESNYFIVVCPPSLLQLKEAVGYSEEQAFEGTGIIALPQLKTRQTVTFDEPYCFLLDRISSLVGEKQISFLNKLEYNSLYEMTKCFILIYKNPGEQADADIEWIAAIIYAWHNSMLFRCYYTISFEPNPFRKYSVIWKRLKNPDFFQQLLLISQEIAKNYEKDDIDLFIKDLDIGACPLDALIYNPESPAINLKTGLQTICRAYGCRNGFVRETFVLIREKTQPFFTALNQLQRIFLKSNGAHHDVESAFKKFFEEFDNAFSNTLDAETIKNTTCYHFGGFEYQFSNYFERFVLEYFKFIQAEQSYDTAVNRLICLNFLLDQMKLCSAAAKNVALYDEGVAQYLDASLVDGSTARIVRITKEITEFRNYYNI